MAIILAASALSLNKTAAQFFRALERFILRGALSLNSELLGYDNSSLFDDTNTI